MGDYFVRAPILAVAIAAALAGLGVALIHAGREHHPLAPPVIYGVRGTIASNPYGPGGIDTTCTKEHYGGTPASWTCIQWSVLLSPDGRDPVPTVPPRPHGRVRCRTLEVDQETASWECVSDA